MIIFLRGVFHDVGFRELFNDTDLDDVDFDFGSSVRGTLTMASSAICFLVVILHFRANS